MAYNQYYLAYGSFEGLNRFKLLYIVEPHDPYYRITSTN